MTQTMEHAVGKVIKVTRKEYLVNVDGRTIRCAVRGKLVSAPDGKAWQVRVGDDVRIRLVDREQGVIEEILPRKSKLSRTVEGKAYREHIIATNVDQMLIVMAAREPRFKSGLLDRYLVIAEKNHLNAVICVNKIDLASREEFADYAHWYPRLGYPLFFTSAVTGEGLDELKNVLQNKVTVLVGHSGVGKSSLIKTLEPGLDLKVASISEKTGKGRHTTTFVQLFPLSFGGYIIDTPGIRELGLWDIYRDDLRHYFVEFREYQNQCQFNDCRHLQEPGCAVKQAVAEGKIFTERYENYRNIYLSLRAAPYERITPRAGKPT